MNLLSVTGGKIRIREKNGVKYVILRDLEEVIKHNTTVYRTTAEDDRALFYVKDQLGSTRQLVGINAVGLKKVVECSRGMEFSKIEWLINTLIPFLEIEGQLNFNNYLPGQVDLLEGRLKFSQGQIQRLNKIISEYKIDLERLEEDKKVMEIESNKQLRKINDLLESESKLNQEINQFKNQVNFYKTKPLNRLLNAIRGTTSNK